MRIAALYDIHGNLPALEAVLEEIRKVGVDQIVVGGDVLPGPMPNETLARLLDLEMPVQFIHGNGELAVLAQVAALDSGAVTYWGTASGNPPPEGVQDILRWTASQVTPEYRETLRGWPATLAIDLSDIDAVLFCHGTPRSEVESFTRLTPENCLLPVFQGSAASLVVCGHTHMQFDRMVGRTRVVNAGSVGAPFGRPGADWLLLSDDVQLQHTSYDLAGAADRVRATRYPQADEFARRSILEPPSEEEMARVFANISFSK